MCANRNLLFCVLAGVVIGGCAAKPTTDHKRVGVERVHHPEPLPAGQVLIRPTVIVDDGAVELLGRELSPQARAAFNQARDARIKRRLESPRPISMDWEGAGVMCVQFAVTLPVVGLALCPVALAAGAAAADVAEFRRVEPTLFMPDSDAARLAASISERTTAAALGARTAQLVDTVESKTTYPSESSVVVRLQSVQMSQMYVRPPAQPRSASPFRSKPPDVKFMFLVIRVAAEAQAISGDGTVSAPTQHVYEWEYGPVSQWIPEHREAAEEAVMRAIPALAHSIAATYARTPKREEARLAE